MIETFAFHDCGERQKMADTYKECRPFLPLSRLFCSAVFRLQNVLTEPLKKSVLNWADTHMRMTAKGIQISTDCILFHRSTPPVFFHTFYDIFENLIGLYHFY